MGIVIRQGFKGTVINYIGVAFGAFNLLYLFPKLLPPEIIGLTRVLLDISFMLAGIAQLGTTGIVDRFYPFFKDTQKKDSGFLLLILTLPFTGFLLISILFLFLRDYWFLLFRANSSLLLDFYYYLIPLTFFSIYLSVLEAYCRAQFRIVVPLFFKEIYLRIFFALIVVLYYYKVISLSMLILFLIISYASAVLLLLSYLKVLRKLYIRFFSVKENRENIKNILHFSMVVFSSSALGLIASKIDVILLSAHNGLKITGVYSIAFYIGTIIEIPRRSISQISVPLISNYWRNMDLKGIKDLYARVALNQSILGFIIFLLIWCNVDPLLSLIPNSEEFKAGKYIILYIGLSRLVDMLTGINTEIINTSPYYKINFFLTIFSAVTAITFNKILIPLYGMEGAGMSTLIVYTIFNFIKIYYIWLKTKIQPFTVNTMYVLLAGVVIYAITSFFDQQVMDPEIPLVRIIGNSVLIAVLFLLSIYFFRLSPDIRDIIDKRWLKKK
jgi:O-antigen/teichoic acid export membrane protein